MTHLHQARIDPSPRNPLDPQIVQDDIRDLDQLLQDLIGLTVLFAVFGEGVPEALEISPSKTHETSGTAPVEHQLIEQDAAQKRLPGPGRAMQEEAAVGRLLGVGQLLDIAPDLPGPGDRRAVRGSIEEILAKLEAEFIRNLGGSEGLLDETQADPVGPTRTFPRMRVVVPVEERSPAATAALPLNAAA